MSTISPAERLREMTHEDHSESSTQAKDSKSVDKQLVDIQARLAQIEDHIVDSGSSSVEGKSTTVERGSSEESWDNENIDNWCKKVDELISNYTTRPSRIAKHRLRSERKISVENKCKVTKLRRKKLRQKRRRKRSKSKSASLETTDKRLKSIEKMLKSLSKSPSQSERRRLKRSRRSTGSSIRKRKKSSSRNSSDSRSSTTLECRMDNIQLLLDAARESSAESSRSMSEEEPSKLSHVAETLNVLRSVFGSLAGREIMDKELISELIQMQNRLSA